MTARDTGGPAFPVPTIMPTEGMTLRDYFAAAALPAIVAKLQSAEVPDFDELFAVHAAMAYAQADAMLAERAK